MLLFTTIKNASHLVFEDRVIPFVKQVANVPFEVFQALVGQPHIEEYTGQVDLPDEHKDYADGKVGDPKLEDFAKASEPAADAKGKKK